MELNPKNILVVQVGKLGDMVLTSPLFYELKKLFPKATLKVLASEVNQEFVSGLKIVDEVIVYHKSVFKDLFLAKNLKKNNFDLWIDVKPGYSRTSAALLKVAKPQLSMGYNQDEKIFDVELKNFAKGKHAIDLSLAPIYYFGKEPVYTKPVLDSFLEAKNGTKDISADILINLSAGSPSRYLHPIKWTQFISQVFGKYPNMRIHLIGIEEDSKFVKEVSNNLKTDHISHKFNYSLKELINVLNSAKIIISADTSIVHLASGINKPVVALFPKVDWNLERFKPRSDNFEVLISDSEKGIEHIKPTVIFEKFEALYNRV